MRLNIAAYAVVSSMAAATPPREARRVTVLVEHDVDDNSLPTRARCTAMVDASNADAAVAAAARHAVNEDADAPVTVQWRRADVATVAISQRRDPKALPCRAFATLAALDINGVALPLPERDAVVDGNHASATAATPWDGGVVLAAYVATRPELFRGKRVVELGCGAGALPGLASALLGASSVVLTDVPAALPVVQRRVESVAAPNVAVAALDWREGVGGLRDFNVVLAADTIWLDDLVEPFVNCVAELLAGGGRLLLAHQTRSTAVDDELFSALSRRGLACSEIPRDDLAPDFRPDHIRLFEVSVG
jgi:predicted nicotinamide N-methyase